ncbi:ATP-binding cassette domain-containing protein, partial [Burkholderia pseudomallei]|uniref:ATP-binding cassette domain-containing protein n=1 Tax=Burkholderia pseudomallei TaxID=28450 RepID=UPI00135DEA8E
MAKLCAQQVSVVYASRRGALTALENVSMSVGSGEIVVALGASGCGKSTLLSLLAGFQPPTSGRVSVDGVPVAGPGADRGVVFQDDALMPWLNVIENVAFGLRMQGVGRDARHARARDVLRLVKLAGFEQHRIDEISGGMRQRVRAARAPAAGPSVLPLGEPLRPRAPPTRPHMPKPLVPVGRRNGKGVVLIKK